MNTRLILSVGLFCAACSTEPQQNLSHPDASTPLVFGFVGDSSASSRAVFLRGELVDQSDLHLEVVAKGLTSLHGLAFRIEFDPETLEHVQTATSGAWRSDVLSKDAVGAPGELAVVWTEVGPFAGHRAEPELVLGNIRFRLLKPAPTALRFKEGWSSAIDQTRASLGATFVGGQIAAQ